MEINTHNAEILLSAANKSHYPQDELPEIALAGRSNVGKSSFINTMLNRKNLARTSGKPGKTQLLEDFHESLGTPQSCAPTFHVPFWKREHNRNQAHLQNASYHQY